jgi:Zn-dependent M16 (insulinase) family peptidase
LSNHRFQNYGNRSTRAWNEFFSESIGHRPSKDDLSTPFKTISESENADPNPIFRHVIVGLAGSDSCFLKQAIPFEISNWEDPEIAAVRVMLQYMTDRMYDKIRGKGWTYGVSMSASVTEGRLTVSFVRSSHIINAYTEFRAIIANYTTMGKKCRFTIANFDNKIFQVIETL